MGLAYTKIENFGGCLEAERNPRGEALKFVGENQCNG
jgi:hypothetical protein